MVDNKNVPPSFFIALRQAIQDKGLQVRTVSKTEQSCPVTVYYEAKYNLAYLKNARLLMTTEGQPTDPNSQNIAPGFFHFEKNLS